MLFEDVRMVVELKNTECDKAYNEMAKPIPAVNVLNWASAFHNHGFVSTDPTICESVMRMSVVM